MVKNETSGSGRFGSSIKRKRRTGLGRATLVLNLLVLVVNFVLVWAGSESQIGLVQATSRVSASMFDRRSPVGVTSPGYLRLVLSLEGTDVSDEDLDTIERAYDRYVEVVQVGLRNLPDKGPVLQPYKDLARTARDRTERILRTTLRDEGLIARVMATIVRLAR